MSSHARTRSGQRRFRAARSHVWPPAVIGVGVDGSPALELAGAIALAAGAELEVRAVIDDRTPVGVPDEELVPVGETIVDNQARALRQRVRAAARSIGVSVRVETSRAGAADALSAFGADVDLLLIGSSRRSPAGRICLGTTGKALVAGAPCPVVIAPRPTNAPGL